MIRLVLAAALLLLALPLAARPLGWERLPVGYQISPDELLDTIGHGSIRSGTANESRGALLLPRMAAAAARLEAPPRLLLSNAPEVLSNTSLPRLRGILLKADLPAGETRVLVSHANLQQRPLDLVLRMENRGEGPAEVVLEPRASAAHNPVPGASRLDAHVGGFLATQFLKDVLALQARPSPWRPADGDGKHIIPFRREGQSVLVRSFRGLGTCMATLRTDQPLTVYVHAVSAGRRAEASDPVLPRTGSQVRGLFEKPDQDLELTADLGAGLTCHPFGEAERDNPLGVLDGGAWMSGADTTVTPSEPMENRGDFGGITWVRFTAKAAPRSAGALLLMVSGGRKAAVVPRPGANAVLLQQWGGLVLARVKAGETLRFPFTLPPNSWAPVYLVAVPLR